MNAEGMISVSPRHAVKLVPEYMHLITKPPGRDFVVRTLANKRASEMSLMLAELVIAGAETREQFPLANTYPLHFRKTYFPGSMHGDPALEFERQARAHELIGVPPPIGHTPKTYRGCFLPGIPYNRLSPFGVDPEDQNIQIARELPLSSAAGLWMFMEQAFARLESLHQAGFAHNDVELHNLITCPAPLELVIIDFERSSISKDEDDAAWAKKCAADFQLILREAIYLQCAMGLQTGVLAELAWEEIDRLFTAPDRFRRAIHRQAQV